MSLKYRWEGVKELQRLLSRAPSELKNLCHKKMDEKSGEVVFIAKHYVPVRTGYLRETIYYRPVGFLQFLIEAYAEYAGFVEYGTSKQRAQPYMRPAMSAVLPVLEYEIMKVIREWFLKNSRGIR